MDKIKEILEYREKKAKGKGEDYLVLVIDIPPKLTVIMKAKGLTGEQLGKELTEIINMEIYDNKDRIGGSPIDIKDLKKLKELIDTLKKKNNILLDIIKRLKGIE